MGKTKNEREREGISEAGVEAEKKGGGGDVCGGLRAKGETDIDVY